MDTFSHQSTKDTVIHSFELLMIRVDKIADPLEKVIVYAQASHAIVDIVRQLDVRERSEVTALNAHKLLASCDVGSFSEYLRSRDRSNQVNHSDIYSSVHPSTSS